MSDQSPQGRRVLVAVLTGRLCEVVQAWRLEHDPNQARRLPPHATLCYWAPQEDDAEALERQVRHAFAESVSVRLGGVHEFSNRDGTFFIEVQETDGLNAARARLYDGRFLNLDGDANFTWHVTCVRYPEESKRDALRSAGAELSAEIAKSPEWVIDRIAWLELRGDVYQPIREWDV